MIPKIIHRTIQHDTNEVIDTCWEKMQELHPDWEFKTWYDEDEYPYVGEYLDQCIAGAFRADLIRLDVVYRFGGVYLDSDVLLVKPLDDLLEHDVWVAGEGLSTYGNLAFGAMPEHPIIKETIDKAIELIPMMASVTDLHAKNGERTAWGPYVHTEVMFRRPEVVRLDTKAFAPYSLIHQSDELPIFRPIKTVKSIPAPKLTNETYGVHLMNWSWNPQASWDNRA